MYLYMVIVPHVMFITLMYKATYDTFVSEPARVLQEIEKAKLRRKEGEE